MLLSDCWYRFQELCEKESLSVPSYYKSRRALFKYKIIQTLPDITIIPRQSTDLEDDIIISSSLSMVDVCALLKDDLNNEELKLPAYNKHEIGQMALNEKAELTEENAFNLYLNRCMYF